MQAASLSRLLCPRSLKVEYDKLANEKTEMQRHYVMVRSGLGRRATLRAAQGPAMAELRSRGAVETQCALRPSPASPSLGHLEGPKEKPEFQPESPARLVCLSWVL